MHVSFDLFVGKYILLVNVKGIISYLFIDIECVLVSILPSHDAACKCLESAESSPHCRGAELDACRSRHRQCVTLVDSL